MQVLIINLLLCFALSSGSDLESTGQIKLDISEPSDICLSADRTRLYVVSDKGRLFETDLKGNTLRRADYKGADFEAVCAVGKWVYVVDETLRMIIRFDADDFEYKDSRQYIYLGGMNRGWEAILHDEDRDRFITFTEKLPLLMFEFDDDLDQKDMTRLKDIKEVSGATYHNGDIWLLSDEDRTVYRVSPKSFKVKESWVIPVLNPEGLTFSPDGKELWVVSDDLHRIYKFKAPAE